MSNYLKLTSFFLLFISIHCFSQEKYWINQNELSTYNLTELKPSFCSEWLGLCTYELSKEEAQNLQEAGVELLPALHFEPLSNQSITLGFALEQVEAQEFINLGINGRGVKIGIIDGGFLKADKEPSLRHFFESDQIKYYKDYVTPDLKVYGGLSGLDDNHGTEVWQMVGGYHPEKRIRYGLATEADYYLARTDHGGFEKRIEEEFLIAALEDMHAKGVKLVNISLGYNIGFTDKDENYHPNEMDGKTSASARAVEHAATEKGMLIVVAAGNEGNISWETLSTPADAEHALSVGSSKLKVWDKTNYSSIGPTYIDYVKPDISVYSSHGTSFSAPIITGMAACLWQMDSTLTNMDLIDIFKKAGNFYPYPNNYLGYGVPTCPELLKVIKGQKRTSPKTIKTRKSKISMPVPDEVKYVVAYHKKDDRNVISRTTYRYSGKKIKVKKPNSAIRTSVLMGPDVIEIYWK